MDKLQITFAERLHMAVAGLEWRCLSALSILIDVLPSAAQYGIGRTIRNRLLALPMRRLIDQSSSLDSGGTTTDASTRPDAKTLAVLVTGSLDTGGVEAIVATLASELPAHSVGTEVLAAAGGATADHLRTRGVSVVECDLPSTAAACVATLPRNAVLQLHNAPDHLVDICLNSGRPVVQVLHNTDINLPPERWRRESEVSGRCVTTVAVSETVLRFHEHHLPVKTATPSFVIPNGVDSSPYTDQDRRASRSALASFLNVSLDDATVFVCLARYELQKNIPGLVAGFLKAAERMPGIHLVVAGPTADWLEYRMADAQRRQVPAGARVHLLGTSSPRLLLAAADAFLLDSFFEGWPVAATEAIMAGIPVVSSDVGGAVELIGPLGDRGYLVPNPAGSPITMSRGLIRRARRRLRHQGNQAALEAAILRTHAEVAEWRGRRHELAADARRWLGSNAMAEAHARVLKRFTVEIGPFDE